MPNAGGSRWLVPQNLYGEIRQDAVLLKASAGNEAATAFLAFLKTRQPVRSSKSSAMLWIRSRAPEHSDS